MIKARAAVDADIDELVRLRGVMLASMSGADAAAGEWQANAAATLRTRLADASLAGFVIDRPGHVGGLAACALGTVEQRLGGPDNPTGLLGYVFNVATDDEFRRRGYSRACMVALLDWYTDRGVARIDLHATTAGEPLYRSLGFAPKMGPTLRLRLDSHGR